MRSKLPAPTIRVRPDALRRLAQARGWKTDTAIGKGLGVTCGTVGRTRRGETRPSDIFIAAALWNLETTFEDLFEVVSPEEAERLYYTHSEEAVSA